MTVEVAVLISIVSVAFSVYFGLKNNKRSDSKEIEDRVKDINIKLDNINSMVQDIKAEITSMRTDIKSHNDRIIMLEASCKQAHKRIDELNSRLNMNEDKEAKS